MTTPEEEQGFEGKEIRVLFDCQKRTTKHRFKLFIIENRRSLRGFKVFLAVAIISIVIWLISKNIFALIIMLTMTVFLLVVLIGYFRIWMSIIKKEEEDLLRRASVKEGILRYGAFGIVFMEQSKNTLYKQSFAWIRYQSIVEWGKCLFLVPRNEQETIFWMHKGEVGKESFLAFRDFVKSKLKYQLIKTYREVI